MTDYSYWYWCFRIIEFVAGCIGFIGMIAYFEGLKWWTIILMIIWVVFFGTMLVGDLLLDDEWFPWCEQH